jgi:hypothetical protein
LNQYLHRYPFYRKYISEKFDIITYLKVFNEFKYLKELILTQDQRKYLKTAMPVLKPDYDDENVGKSELEIKDRSSQVAFVAKLPSNILNINNEILKR